MQPESERAAHGSAGRETGPAMRSADERATASGGGAAHRARKPSDGYVPAALKLFAVYVVFLAIFGTSGELGLRLGLVPSLISGQPGGAWKPLDYYPMVRPPHASFPGLHGGDFVASYAAGQALLAGRSIYKHHAESLDCFAGGESARYSYPPLQAYLMAPLAWLPFDQAYGVWRHITVALLALSLFFSARLTTSPDRPEVVAWLAFAAGLFIFAQATFLSFQLERGQTDALPLLCATLAVYFVVRRDNPWLAGLFCALGAGIKVIPAVIGLFFVLRGNWRAALASIGFGLLLVLITGPADWLAWWTDVVPAHRGLFIGQNVDHSLLYVLEGFTGHRALSETLAKIVGLTLLALLAGLVLLNRRRRELAVLEFTLLMIVVEVSTPWSVNYKLVMLALFFIAPFVLLDIEWVRRRPLRYAAPLFVCYLLIVPIFGEYLTRLPFSWLANAWPLTIVGPNPVDGFLTDRRAAVGLLFGFAYLLGIYALMTRRSRMGEARGPARRPRLGGGLALAAGGALLLALAGWSLWRLTATEPYSAAIAAFGEPRPMNDSVSLAGAIPGKTADNRPTLDLVFASRGPLPRNLALYMHAHKKDATGATVAVYGVNFFPSLITTLWPAGKYVVAWREVDAPLDEYDVKVGFFDLNDGARFGEADVGAIDFLRAPARIRGTATMPASRPPAGSRASGPG